MIPAGQGDEYKTEQQVHRVDQQHHDHGDPSGAEAYVGPVQHEGGGRERNRGRQDPQVVGAGIGQCQVAAEQEQDRRAEEEEQPCDSRPGQHRGGQPGGGDAGHRVVVVGSESSGDDDLCSGRPAAHDHDGNEVDRCG